MVAKGGMRVRHSTAELQRYRRTYSYSYMNVSSSNTNDEDIIPVSPARTIKPWPTPIPIVAPPLDSRDISVGRRSLASRPQEA